MSFEGAATSSRGPQARTVPMLLAENSELRDRLAKTETALREARIELSQVKG